ncbi:MAG: DUF1028 domain-containing protein, partial [Paracoccaceae bacterium]
APSTFWGEGVLTQMQTGLDAETAVARVTSADAGRAQRQLAALDMAGGSGLYTGPANDDAKGGRVFPNGVVSGNMLTDTAVLDDMARAFRAAPGPLDRRLLAALAAARAAGGDFRGLMSAALLVLHPGRAPLSLRVDYHPDDPLAALAALHERATTGAYADWALQVPNPAEPQRVLD